MEFTVLCRHVLSSKVQGGGACGARAAAMLVHTVSLGVGMLRGLLERAKLLFAIVDLMSVNGTAFRSCVRRVRNPYRSFAAGAGADDCEARLAGAARASDRNIHH
eukprot:scaffold19172_cov129-Isochrysis_galbana.AAC.1